MGTRRKPSSKTGKLLSYRPDLDIDKALTRVSITTGIPMKQLIDASLASHLNLATAERGRRLEDMVRAVNSLNKPDDPAHHEKQPEDST